MNGKARFTSTFIRTSAKQEIHAVQRHAACKLGHLNIPFPKYIYYILYAKGILANVMCAPVCPARFSSRITMNKRSQGNISDKHPHTRAWTASPLSHPSYRQIRIQIESNSRCSHILYIPINKLQIIIIRKYEKFRFPGENFIFTMKMFYNTECVCSV